MVNLKIKFTNHDTQFFIIISFIHKNPMLWLGLDYASQQHHHKQSLTMITFDGRKNLNFHYLFPNIFMVLKASRWEIARPFFIFHFFCYTINYLTYYFFACVSYSFSQQKLYTCAYRVIGLYDLMELFTNTRECISFMKN